tara:strand:+ start:550 stop:1158 length:609 start_codon:yes stop_codon:yes gene_type:complete
MYEGLANILQLKGMGMTEDAIGFQRAFRLADMIPVVAAQAMPKQAMQPAPMPPQMSAPVYKEEGGKMVDGDDYVVDAYTVAALGNGSSEAGAEVLDNVLPETNNSDQSYNGMVTAKDGDGMSDNVEFRVEDGGNIEGAKISKDEYIIDQDQVAAIGGGDVDEGTRNLDKMREEIRQAAYGTTEQPNEINGKKLASDIIKGLA